MGDLQPPADAGLGAERAQRVGVADDGHPVALGQRLVDHELGDVEHLVDVLDPDHPGLAQHRVEGLRPDPGVVGRGAPAGTP